MHLVILIVIALLTSKADAQVLNLEHLSLDVGRYSANREPMTPDIPLREYKGYVQLNWNVGFGDLVKWENHVKTAGTDSKFETVYWEYTVSIPTRWGIEPFMYHKSQHTMDAGQPTIDGRLKAEKFPVQDAVGIRFVFFTKGK